MQFISTLFLRIVSILATLGLIYPMVQPESRGVLSVTPGEELPQTPFSCVAESKKDSGAANDLALAFNAVYRLFGGVDREKLLVSDIGNEPTWYEWNALKIAWCRDEGLLRRVKDRIRDFPQTDNGYFWSWGDSPCWHSGNGVLHYDGLFRYVIAVADILRWEGGLSLLSETDRTTYGSDTAVDASKGRTVYEKCALAMEYALNELNGKDGLITITEKSAFLADGSTRFDIGSDGSPVWNNTGKAGSSPSNYWDNLPFGNKDAYETALYYKALNSMRDIELMRGNDSAAKDCENLAAKVKKNFDKTFWNPLTGRYIACVDIDGKKWDPGLTFLNVEALAYGLGDSKKAKKIFSWLDGKRIVPTDTLRGKDIMDYGLFLNRNLGSRTVKKRMPFVPMANTLSIERASGVGESWWCSLNGAINIGARSNAFYGSHLENGGYIFYSLYYELTARQMYLGADSVSKRAGEIAEIYRFNGLNSAIGWAEGLIGVFPESGIVSRAFISSLAGVDATIDGLEVRPDVPNGIKTLGVDALRYCGVPITVSVGINTLTINADSALSGILRYYPDSLGKYKVTITSEGEEVMTKTVAIGPDGAVTIDMGTENAVSIVISPVDQ